MTADSGVSLRAADASDAECLSALAVQVFLETYATDGIRLALVREAEAQFSVAAFRNRLADPTLLISLAERHGHLVAFSELVAGARHPLIAPGPAAELSRLYVQSPFLGRGIGARLLQHAEASASATGASILWLTAWVGNKRALAFYASKGYAQAGVTAYTFEGESFENRLFVRTLRART